MLIFWIICALLILLTLWFVLPPLLQRTEQTNTAQAKEANVAVYRDQLRELEDDLRNGIVGQGQYDQDRDEVGRRLLEDLPAKPLEYGRIRALAVAQTTVSAFLVVLSLVAYFLRHDTQKLILAVRYVLVVGLPIIGAAFYLTLRNPKALAREMPYAVAIVIPALAVIFYLWNGNLQAVSGTPDSSTSVTTSSAPAADRSGEITPQQIAANVDKLAERLKQNPNDAQGWLMLARSYVSMERYSEAASAYEHLTTLNANDADVWADYGEAMAIANGRQLSGKPIEAINRALQIDPKNQKALALAGSAAFEAADYNKAINYWERLLPQLPPNSDLATAVSKQVKKAKELAGSKGSR